jgi:hypothetical protein
MHTREIAFAFFEIDGGDLLELLTNLPRQRELARMMASAMAKMWSAGRVKQCLREQKNPWACDPRGENAMFSHQCRESGSVKKAIPIQNFLAHHP